MSTGNLRLAFVIEAIDRATATVGRVNKAIDKVTAPLRRVRDASAALVAASRLDRVQAAWSALGQSGQRVMGWMRGVTAGAAALAIAAAGVGFAVKRNFDEVDRLSDQAQKLGITTQAYQKLGFAARQNGSSQEAMGQSLTFLSQNMAEALSGNKEMVVWFERAGISMQQLGKMNVQQVLAAIADKFSTVADTGQNAARKIAHARALMGRGGAEMIQLLNQGSAEMRRQGEAAERLGVVLSDDVVERIRKFNDEADVMSDVLTSAAATVFSAAAPAMGSMAKSVVDWANANRDLMASRLSELMKKLEPQIPALANGLFNLASVIADVVIAVNQVVQAIGGWQTIVAAITGVILGKGLLAVVALTQGVWGLVAALAATPFGLVVAGAAVVVGLFTVLYNKVDAFKNIVDTAWASLKRLFGAEGGAGSRVTNLPADDAPSIYAGPEAWAAYRGRQGAAGTVVGVAGGGKVEVGGRLRIDINTQGELRRFEAQSKGGLEYDVYAGMPMAGA